MPRESDNLLKEQQKSAALTKNGFLVDCCRTIQKPMKNDEHAHVEAQKKGVVMHHNNKLD